VRSIFLLGLLALFGFALWSRWYAQTPRPVVKHYLHYYLRRAGIVLVMGLFLLLIVTGRLPWLMAVLGALVAGIARLLPLLLRYAPFLQRLWASRPRQGTAAGGANRSTAPNQSTVEAQFVRMTLNHDSGEMDGEVLAGTFAGKPLHGLDLNHLAQLLLECQAADEESAALIQAYLERIYGEDWQAQVNAQAHHGSSDSGQITPQEAYQILGLAPGANEQEILAAHRRLMQKLHPDHGGSDYLAAKINQAKAVLLGK
jgi:hypothetical protein